MLFGIDLAKRRNIVLWQALVLLSGTSWLLAPHLNPALSSRTSLISQYENSAQPYSWAFRLGDAVCALLLAALAYFCIRNAEKRVVGWLLAIISGGLFLDAVLSTSCRVTGQSCVEYFSLIFVLHAAETITTSAAIFIASAYDAWQRKKLVSISFTAFQIGYGLLFLSQLANQQHFNTLSQYTYETVLIAWLAWFGRDFLVDERYRPRKKEWLVVKYIAAVWAFLNGILAILLSLRHISLLGRFKGLYFAGDNAWLAQHGVVIGVVLLYISRHLARGEMRARQVFLAVTGVEALKYSVITPNPSLMILYLLTFITLFVLPEDFDRGTVAITWQIKLRELRFMAISLLVAALVALLTLDRDNRVSIITGRAFDNFFDYVFSSDFVSRLHPKSALLAHTISVFVTTAAAMMLWILFRPTKLSRSNKNPQLIEMLLKKHSNSTEDFFKLWPPDKDYFLQKNGDGFIAYKRSGTTIFGLADPMSARPGLLLDEFVGWARAHRLTACLLPVYSDSLNLYKKAGLEVLQIGASAVIDIDKFMNETSKDKWWRWKKNRAAKDGYEYEVSVPPHSDQLMERLKAVSDSWLSREGRTERGFALGYFDAHYLQRCTIHLLKDSAGQIIAFTNQLPQFTSTDTATVDLLRFDSEARDAMPYLLYMTIVSLAEKPDYRYFDLGFVPFAKARGPLLVLAKLLSAGRFSSSGLEQFKNKFDPDWQPNYLAYDGDLADLALVALNLEGAMQVEETKSR